MRVFIGLLLASISFAQNLQLHYETAKDRGYFVSTLEMFQPDAYGSTFWFVDMEYDSQNDHGMSLGYWEIARVFQLPVERLSATVQYNDGVASFGALGQTWLVGVNYVFQLGAVDIPLDILYRAQEGADGPDVQLTATWFQPLLDGHLEWSGFLDIWSQDGAGGTDWVLLSEPQLWYNANDHFAVGSEVEISSNFVFGETGLVFKPTLGLRWTF